MFNVLNWLLKPSHTVHIDTQECIEWNLAVDISLTVHIAALIVLLLIAKLSRLPLRQNLSKHTIAHLKLYFANNAVFPLAIACPVQENNSFQDWSVTFLDILILHLFIVCDHIAQIFNRQLSIANNKFLLVLVQYYRDVKQLLCTLRQVILNIVLSVEFVCVHCVHWDFKVVNCVVVIFAGAPLNVVGFVNVLLV